MKKQIVLVIALIATLSTFGQVVSKGDHYASAFLGIGGFYHTSYNHNMLVPPIGAQYEVIYTDKVGIGHIGIGGIATYASFHQHYSYQSLDSYHHYITLGARGIYHFDFKELLDNEQFDKIDLYGGIMLGFNFRRGIENFGINTTRNTYSQLRLATDLFVGGRYFFSDNLAVMAELGYGLYFLNAGVTLKLKNQKN
ncbi:MAG: hypothetical protein CSA95_03050 [Bacteroidetes bacterium]|nr:MAG: hypothetical protein CSA95_03050 [Bacteroidota bacterium]PIE88039.1 MAG: hypothetical protein CSA04_03960 [Bacteroidota bacterium]